VWGTSPARGSAPWTPVSDLAWLTPMENGYSRAIPLLWLPAFTQKAFLRSAEAKKEWEESDGSELSLMPRAERTSWSLSLLMGL
jgi:hypothetical protein